MMLQRSLVCIAVVITMAGASDMKVKKPMMEFDKKRLYSKEKALGDLQKLPLFPKYSYMKHVIVTSVSKSNGLTSLSKIPEIEVPTVSKEEVVLTKVMTPPLIDIRQVILDDITTKVSKDKSFEEGKKQLVAENKSNDHDFLENKDIPAVNNKEEDFVTEDPTVHDNDFTTDTDLDIDEIKGFKSIEADKTSESESLPTLGEKDLNEYIFVEMLSAKPVVGTTGVIDTNMNSEITETNILATNNRLKRSNNVIEEENFATTQSGLKFTKREGHLIDDFHFKNIHS